MTLRLAEAKRIVIKTGSTLVTDDNGQAKHDWLRRLAADLKHFKARGQQIVWVSSGAVSLGRTLLFDRPTRSTLSEKQAAAALGQPLLMAAISDALGKESLVAAQSLLTLEDTERRRRWLNARDTLEILLNAGAIPLINENDTVATDEIRYGDNDRLAARVAQMISADVLVLLSDVDGLYSDDPRLNPKAEHIPVVDVLTPEIMALAGGSNSESGLGSGGMTTKLLAAEIAYAAGCATVITMGDRDQPLRSIEDGARSSWIIPSQSPLSARRAWLSGHLVPEGTLTLDAGAAVAVKKGLSLLPVGVTNVHGRFAKGAALSLVGPDGATLGKGVSAYASSDIEKIRGLKTDATEAVLGYRGRPAIIHRDDLVLDQ